jgi:hypothetical protein
MPRATSLQGPPERVADDDRPPAPLGYLTSYSIRSTAELSSFQSSSKMKFRCLKMLPQVESSTENETEQHSLSQTVETPLESDHVWSILTGRKEEVETHWHLVRDHHSGQDSPSPCPPNLVCTAIVAIQLVHQIASIFAFWPAIQQTPVQRPVWHSQCVEKKLAKEVGSSFKRSKTSVDWKDHVPLSLCVVSMLNIGRSEKWSISTHSCCRCHFTELPHAQLRSLVLQVASSLHRSEQWWPSTSSDGSHRRNIFRIFMWFRAW